LQVIDAAAKGATGDESGEYFVAGLGECATLILRLPRSSGLETPLNIELGEMVRSRDAPTSKE
jgi:hypothetical protein